MDKKTNEDFNLLSKFMVGAFYKLGPVKYILYRIDRIEQKPYIDYKEYRFFRVYTFLEPKFIYMNHYYRVRSNEYIDITNPFTPTNQQLQQLQQQPNEFLIGEPFDRMLDKYLQYVLKVSQEDYILKIQTYRKEKVRALSEKQAKKIGEELAEMDLKLISAKCKHSEFFNKKENFVGDGVSNDITDNTSDNSEEVSEKDLKSDSSVSTETSKKRLKQKNRKFSNIKDRKKFVQDYLSLNKINSKRFVPEELKAFREKYEISPEITNADISNFVCRCRKEELTEE